MDELRKDYFENDFSPVDEVQIIGSQEIQKIFISPEEIEEILCKGHFTIPIDIFRKLRNFRYFFGEELEWIEKEISESDIEKICKDYTISQLLIFFRESTELLVKRDMKKYVVYFLAIEKAYELETGYPLSFKGLEEPVGYDNHLGY